MRALTAVLYIDDSAPAPTAGISVELDGQPILQRADVPPTGWMAVVDALGASLNQDLHAHLSGPLAELVIGLEAVVETGRATQDARERALVDWQQAAGTNP